LHVLYGDALYVAVTQTIATEVEANVELGDERKMSLPGDAKRRMSCAVRKS
jgi:hypothetical protein